MCVLVCLFVGLAQYSGDPRIEWHLNAFSTKDAVIDAVKNLPYKGGNTLTGTASFHFSPLHNLSLSARLSPSIHPCPSCLIHSYSLSLSVSLQALH